MTWDKNKKKGTSPAGNYNKTPGAPKYYYANYYDV